MLYKRRQVVVYQVVVFGIVRAGLAPALTVIPISIKHVNKIELCIHVRKIEFITAGTTVRAGASPARTIPNTTSRTYHNLIPDT